MSGATLIEETDPHYVSDYDSPRARQIAILMSEQIREINDAADMVMHAMDKDQVDEAVEKAKNARRKADELEDEMRNYVQVTQDTWRYVEGLAVGIGNEEAIVKKYEKRWET